MAADLEKPVSLSTLYGDLWRYAEGARHHILVAFFLLLASQLFKLALPWLAGNAIDAIQHGGLAGLSDAGRWLALVFAATVASWALHGPGRILERNVALQVRERLAGALTHRLFHAPLAWHEAQQSGAVARRVEQSTQALYDFAQSQFIYLQNAVRLFGPVIALILIAWQVGAVAVAGYCFLGYLIVRFDRRMMTLAVQENQAERHYAASLVDGLGNVLTVLALRRSTGVAALVAQRLKAIFAPLRAAIVLNEAKWCTVDLLASLLWCALVGLYAWLASQSPAPEGSPGLALGKVFMVYEYAQQAGGVITAIAAHFQSLARQQSDYAAAAPILAAPQMAEADAPRAGTWQHLQLTDLCQRHGDSDTLALRQVQLSLRRGTRYALIGPSGAGKSTLLRILAGLDAPCSGSVSFDGGAPVAEPGGVATALRREATLIPQQAELLAGTLGENLTLGTTTDPRAVDTALDLACATPFLTATTPTEDRLGQPVAEGGANWSGGQRQRLALARGALAAEGSALLLLDEPSSSLDPETERQVYTRFMAHFATLGNACVVSSLHRLHLLDHYFDEVILMQDGQVADVGTPAALAQRSALFRDLMAAQGQGG